MTCNGAIGRNGKLYIKSGDTDTSDTALPGDTEILALLDDTGWKHVCLVDANRNAQKDKIDTSDRCSGDYKAFVPGQQEGTISFKAYKRKPILAGDWLDILRTAYRTNSVVTVLMLDDDRTVEGADGLVANVNVFNMSENQVHNGAIELDFELAVSGCTTHTPPARDITRPASGG